VTAQIRIFPALRTAAPAADKCPQTCPTVVLYTADAGENGRWHYVSPQIESMLGFTPEEWCRDPGLWARRLHPDDAPWVLSEETGFADGARRSPVCAWRTTFGAHWSATS
jgi:PAS domain-containing protein